MGALLLSACSDSDETMPVVRPESTFSISISGMEDADYLNYGVKLPIKDVYMRASGLPEDEEILFWGSVMSAENKMPQIGDSRPYLFPTGGSGVFEDWDWSEDFYFRCFASNCLTPGVTHYVRGYVITSRGEYYTDPVEVVIDDSCVAQETAPDYEIPVVFNVFPSSDGSFIPEDVVENMFSWCNLALRNAFDAPGCADTGIRLVLADLPGLDKPGWRYIDEPTVVMYGENVDLKLRPEWRTDIDKAVNVWILPIDEPADIEFENLVDGFAYLPVFYPGEVMDGCVVMPDEDTPPFRYRPGLLLDADAIIRADTGLALVHELGHFLGLYHVYDDEDYCADTLPYDRAGYIENSLDMGHYRYGPDNEKYASVNVMDYMDGFFLGFTPDQRARMRYTIMHAPFTPANRVGK